MKIALTGGSGQLGTLLLRRLLDDRKVKSVVSVDLRPPSLVGAKLQHVRADIRDSSLEAHFSGCDAVLHLAFLGTQLVPRAEFDAVNIGGSRNVFRAAAAAGVRHVLYASSVAAYGMVPGHPVPIVEDTPRVDQPDFPYPAAKFQVEAFLDAFEKEHPEVLVTRIRPSAVIGRRMEHRLGRALLAGLIPDVGNAPAPLVWDEDVADAFMLALKQGAAGAYIVSAEEPATADELARASGLRRLRLPRPVLSALAHASPWLARLGLGPSLDPAWISHAGVAMVPCSERARTQLGWKPRCPRSVDVMKRFAEMRPGRTDLRIAAFFRMTGLASRLRPPIDELRGVESRVHLDLTGPGGGDYTLAVKDRRLSVRPGLPRPPTSVATLPAALWLELLAGRTDYSSAQLTGRLRIEGDPFAGFLLSGIVSMFRAEQTKGGLRSLPLRAFSRWLG
jgi:nucleoside-diphosphate-sugar epimerase/putative sterol carrier protein